MATYKFTQPIRYYKANDPYYYEVDNIPIKQLEENILNVRQNLQTLQSAIGTSTDGDDTGGSSGDPIEFSLSRIKDLKASLVSGRTVRVKSGKFNARINSAYGMKRLLRINQNLTNTPNNNKLINPIYAPWDSSERLAVWNAFIQDVATGGAPYNVNGLETRYTFHPAQGEGLGSKLPPATIETEGHPQYIDGIDYWPGTKQGFLMGLQNSPSVPILDFANYNLGSLHLAFVKHWRAPFRTAVVDFPGGTIEVEPFDDYDYFYEDDDGRNVSLADLATQRIDLLFAYSMPIDASGVAISDYEDSYCGTDEASPKVINRPMLGILRGAGIGLKKSDYFASFDIDTKSECEDDVPAAGDQKKMVGNVHDSDADANYGILTANGVRIHGSFPSPDDLMNITMFPAAGTSTAGDNYNLQLVGQSVLPLAYIVVKKGQTSLAADDIIDIRPFLRTTELSYNERAGIAAANPPLSFANPAVGAFQVKDAIDAAVAPLINAGDSPADYGASGKTIYTDYIMGGLAYGVEGTLLTMSDPLLSNPANYTWNNIAGVTYKGYNFSEFTDGEAYMDSQDLNKKIALLEYLAQDAQQTNLKRLISGFSTMAGANNPAYLGLDSNRNIPIYPEWDIAIDDIGNPNQFLLNTPEFSWWMAMEGHSEKRPYVYAPGGIRGVRNAQPTAKLDREFRQDAVDDGDYYLLQLSTKTFRVNLPDWCQDYDVIVEYTNCSPLTVGPNHSTVGLSVDKAKVFSIAGEKFTFFSVQSACRSKKDVGLVDGKIIDNHQNYATYYDNWLSYSVYSGGMRRQGAFGTGLQSEGANGDATNRMLPKLGAAFYPTVKFTVIAYPTAIYSRNATLTEAGSNKTYVPGAASNGGSAGVIVPQNGVTETIYPPAPTAQDRYSLLDLGSINQ